MQPLPSSPSRLVRTVLLAQGAYYVATGVWPLLDRRSFEAVTGPKTDFWLVRTVGALIGVTGATMLVAAARQQPAPDTAVLAAGSAAALASVDTIYASGGRISRIYLLDAIAELAFIAGWFAALAPGRRI